MVDAILQIELRSILPLGESFNFTMGREIAFGWFGDSGRPEKCNEKCLETGTDVEHALENSAYAGPVKLHVNLRECKSSTNWRRECAPAIRPLGKLINYSKTMPFVDKHNFHWHS
jgi:hypothetical protein